MHPAQSARLEREKHPDRYCTKCLWNVRRSGPCPRHMDAPRSPVERDLNLEALLIASIEQGRKS
jgi:hypothetical protein